jgi:hypothetical protein
LAAAGIMTDFAGATKPVGRLAATLRLDEFRVMRRRITAAPRLSQRSLMHRP